MRIQRLTRTGFVMSAVLVGGLLLGVAPALAVAPEMPTTEAANPIGGTTATLNGTLNPKASGTAGYFFYYGKNGYCGELETTEGAEATGKGIKVSTPVTELEGNTEYMVCVVATHTENGDLETTWGEPVPFKTGPVKPIVEGGEVSVSTITPFQATVSNVSVNPENEPTSCELEYGTTLSYGKSIKCEPESVEGPSPVTVSGTLTGLTADTPYDYRIKTKNGAGETKGAEGTFTTKALEPPIIESESVSFLSATRATLEATVNPNYQKIEYKTEYKFEYATEASYLGTNKTIVVPGGTLPAGFGGQPVHANLGAVLTPGTTYYYRVVATNETGTTAGMVTVSSFKTPTPPTAGTGAAENVTHNTATVSGTVNPEGQETYYAIQYGTSTSYGYTTPPVNVGSESNSIPVGPVALDSLTPNTTYHYRILAITSTGESTPGADETFTTEPAPPQPPEEAESPPPTPTPLTAAPVGSTFPNLTAVAPIPGPKESAETTGTETKSLTRAQKLAKALKACRKTKGKRRASCEKQARSKYGKSTKKKGK
jgi:hypothetical protein